MSNSKNSRLTQKELAGLRFVFRLDVYGTSLVRFITTEGYILIDLICVAPDITATLQNPRFIGRSQVKVYLSPPLGLT